MARVGVVGVGRMGRPMVDRLLAAGHSVSAFARRPELVSGLAAVGVRCVPTPAALGTGQAVVLVCAYTDAQVVEIALDGGLVDSLDPGSVLVVHTTGRPATVLEIEPVAAARRAAVLDAPVSGTPEDAAAGRLTLLVGGDPDAVAAARPVMAAYADPIVEAGPLGAGQQLKLVNNLILGAHVELLADAARVAEELGIDPRVLVAALPHCTGSSVAAEMMVPLGSAADLVASTGPFLGKDIETAGMVAAADGIDLGWLGLLGAALVDRIGRRG